MNILLYFYHQSSIFDTQVLSITDEEKLQLESLLHDNSATNKSIEAILEHNYDNQPNPYKLDEKSIKSLDDINRKLEVYKLDHLNDDLPINNSNDLNN